MESINVHLQKIEELILQIEDVLEGSRPVAFSSKVQVDKNRLYDVIDELKPHLDDIVRDLPDEIVKARRIVADKDKILEDATSKASLMLRQTEADMDRRVSEHEIAKKAAVQADIIVEDARKFAKELRINAYEYADELLRKAEETVRAAQGSFNQSLREIEASFSETIDTIFENRQQLRDGDRKH